MDINKKNKFVYRLAFALIMIVAAYGLYFFQDVVLTYLDKWSLLPRPADFTELYFADYRALPAGIAEGEDISFSFVIRNLSEEEREYPYAVYFRFPDGEVIDLAQGQEAIGAGAERTVDFRGVLPEAAASGSIGVYLSDWEQKISFLF